MDDQTTRIGGDQARQPHAVLDLPTRNCKALKIERLLDLAQRKQPMRMRDAARFRYRNLCLEAWRATFEIERPDSLANRLLRATSDAMLAPLKRIIPTLIYGIEQESA